MINFLKSEHFRLLHKKSLHLTNVICLFLVAAAAVVLYYTHQYDPSFPYATDSFFYSNIIGSGMIIIVVGFIYNATLTGKDMALIKQFVSFGISRRTIFWSKFMLTLLHYLLICVIGILLSVVLAENVLISEGGNELIQQFLIACVNMVPIVLSSFFLIHSMRMMGIAEIYTVITVLFLYVFSGDLLRLLFRPITGLNELYTYAPDTLLSENLMRFMEGSARFGYEYWVTGVVISGLALLIGAKKFTVQDID